MQITFLGTSAMVPTKDRNTSGVLLEYKGKGILFDCGEGTQRQMSLAGLKRTMVSTILISHWHGDHVIGLPGLIQTIGTSMEDAKLTIVGPAGTEEYIYHMMHSMAFDTRVELDIKEINPSGVETVLDKEDYTILAAPMTHGIPCVGYAFVERDSLNIDKSKLKKLGLKPGPYLRKLKDGKSVKVQGKKLTPKMLTTLKKGRKVAYITDTRPNKFCSLLAEEAKILIADGTYTHDLVDKAEEYLHMTAQEAARIASQADAEKLYLSHFSQRYASTQIIEEDARNIFDNSYCAKDLMQIQL